MCIGLFALAGTAGTAGAATPGYPPPPNLNTSCSFSQPITVGGTVTVTVTCKFAPGTTIAITLNGISYGTATAPASGILVETFTDTNGKISLNGGPAVATACGATASFVASGTNPAGGTNVATTLVTAVCPSALASNTPASSGAASASASPGLAFTGADIMAMVIGALALLALGFLILTLTRRRASSS
jgi:hypothetical protein